MVAKKRKKTLVASNTKVSRVSPSHQKPMASRRKANEVSRFGARWNPPREVQRSDPLCGDESALLHSNGEQAAESSRYLSATGSGPLYAAVWVEHPAPEQPSGARFSITCSVL